MLVALLLSCVSGSAIAADPPVTVGLCSAAEVEVFGCETETGKTLSICASPDLAEDKGFLQYRYGKPGAAPELAYPADPKSGSQHGFTYTRYTRFQETSLSLVFTNADVTYTVFATSIEEEGQVELDEGVRVSPKGGSAVSIGCKGPARGSLMSLENKVDEKAWGE